MLKTKFVMSMALAVALFTSTATPSLAAGMKEQKAASNVNEVSNKYIEMIEVDSSGSDLANVLKNLSDSEDIKGALDTEKLEVMESIIESAPQNSQDEYFEIKDRELKNALSIDMNIDESYIHEDIELSDGTTVELEITDQVDSINRSVSLSPYRGEAKDYGDRKYTATAKIKSLGITVVTLQLGTHYTVGNSGLKMRYLSTSGTSGTSLGDVTVANTKTTTASATSVGSTLKGMASYKLTGKLNNGYIELRSSIKLEKLDKSKKYAYVYQSYVYSD